MDQSGVNPFSLVFYHRDTERTEAAQRTLSMSLRLCDLCIKYFFAQQVADGALKRQFGIVATACTP